MRPDGRRPDQLRALEIVTGFQKHAEGSALIKLGDTWVLCAVSVEESVPAFLKGKGQGWLTAEYAMLPRSTPRRNTRDPGGPGRAETRGRRDPGVAIADQPGVTRDLGERDRARCEAIVQLQDRRRDGVLGRTRLLKVEQHAGRVAHGELGQLAREHEVDAGDGLALGRSEPVLAAIERPCCVCDHGREDLPHEVELVGRVPIEAALGHPGTLGDLLDRDGRDPVREEQPERRLDEPLLVGSPVTVARTSLGPRPFLRQLR